jgi:hypothetical protein
MKKESLFDFVTLSPMRRLKCRICKWKKIIPICGILCFAISVYVYIVSQTSNSLFNEISEEDKLAIEPLLKDLVFHNHFGYALIGAKPVAVASYFSQEPFANMVFIRKSHVLNFECSWNVLEKYQSKLNSRNFLFLKEKSSVPLGNRDIYVVVIINKSLFLRTVEQHLGLFKKTLGNWVTPVRLLYKISEAKTSLFEVLGCDEGLYGILLGYGRNNALAFKRNLELARAVDPLFREIAYPFTLHLTSPSLHFCSLEEEYMDFQKQLSLFNLHFPLSSFEPPSFEALREDDETVHLRQKYRAAHRTLVDMYGKEDFLRVTLRQFCSP